MRKGIFFPQIYTLEIYIWRRKDNLYLTVDLESPVGIEPTTDRLTAYCSTAELRRHILSIFSCYEATCSSIKSFWSTRNRTENQVINSHLLYQTSSAPIPGGIFTLPLGQERLAEALFATLAAFFSTRAVLQARQYLGFRPRPAVFGSTSLPQASFLHFIQKPPSE